MALQNVQTACWTPDSSHVITVERGGDVATIRSLCDDDDHVEFKDPSLHYVSITRDGKTVFTAKTGVVTAWDRSSGRQLKVIPTLSLSSISHSVSQDGKFVAECGSDGLVVVWKVGNDNSPWRRIPQGVVAYKITSFSFSSSNCSSSNPPLVAALCSDSKVRIFDLNSTELVACSEARFTRFAWFADGRRLALVQGNTIRIASLRAQRKESRISLGVEYQGHTAPVVALAVCPTGRYIASTDSTSRVCIWNVVTGEQVVPPLAQGTGLIRTISFSPDGKLLMLIDDVGILKVWDLTFLNVAAEVQTAKLGLQMVEEVSTQAKEDIKETIQRQVCDIYPMERRVFMQ